MNATQVVRTTFICFVCSSLVFSVDINGLNRLFKDKTITAKIDLPIIRSVYVTPEGQIDQERYQKRLLKQPPSILQGQTAKLTKIEVKNDVVHVFINRGGVPGFAMGRGSKMLTSRTKAGSRIEIEFGRKVRAEDLTQDMLLNAVSKVISIEGFTSQAVAIRPDETFDTSHRFDPVSKTKTNAMQPVTQTLAMSLLSAEVNPLTPRRGETIALISTFEITALNQQEVASVTLSRQLFFDGNPLFSEPRVTTGSWGLGRHTSSFKLELPASAQAGVYTYVTQILEPIRSEQKKSLFVVE